MLNANQKPQKVEARGAYLLRYPPASIRREGIKRMRLRKQVFKNLARQHQGFGPDSGEDNTKWLILGRNDNYLIKYSFRVTKAP